MKTNFKNISRTGFLVSLAIIVFLPLWIFAQNANDNQKGKAFCATISNLASKYDQKVADRETKLEEKRTEITDKISSRWTERDEKLVEK